MTSTEIDWKRKFLSIYHLPPSIVVNLLAMCCQRRCPRWHIYCTVCKTTANLWWSDDRQQGQQHLGCCGRLRCSHSGTARPGRDWSSCRDCCTQGLFKTIVSTCTQKSKGFDYNVKENYMWVNKVLNAVADWWYTCWIILRFKYKTNMRPWI